METEPAKLTSFSDHKGTRWTIELTVGRVRKIKTALGINLIDVKGDGLARLYNEPMDLADCLYLLCEQDATARGITDEEFGERLAGDTMEQAAAALINAIVFFSPKHQRKPLLVALEKVEALKEKQAAAAIAWLNSESAEREMEALIQTPGDFATSLRASSKSTPRP